MPISRRADESVDNWQSYLGMVKEKCRIIFRGGGVVGVIKQFTGIRGCKIKCSCACRWVIWGAINVNNYHIVNNNSLLVG